MSYPSRKRPRVGRLAAAVLLACALAPATAAGHVRSGISATDYVVTLDPLPAGPASAVSARVTAGDQSLTLVVREGHTVVVLDGMDGRFLRLGPHAGATTWHDGRLRRLPPDVAQGAWSIPLVVDGERVLLQGEVRRVQPPALAPWLALAGAFLVVTALLVAARRRVRLENAVVALAVLTAVATIAAAAGFAVAGEAAAATWVESANEIVLAAAGLAVIAFGTAQARIAVSALLGLLGITTALLQLEVLRHGVVLAAPPADATRAAVVVALAAGTATVIVAATAFAGVLDGDGGATESRARRAPAPPSP
jgi:hypothetical protein